MAVRTSEHATGTVRAARLPLAIVGRYGVDEHAQDLSQQACGPQIPRALGIDSSAHNAGDAIATPVSRLTGWIRDADCLVAWLRQICRGTALAARRSQ